jgi:methionine-rich copper-binding protein CopC
MWIAIFLLVLLLIGLLVYIVLTESATISSFQRTLETLPPPPPPKRNIKYVLVMLALGGATSGANAYFMSRVPQRRQAAAAAAAAFELAAKEAIPTTFIQVRMVKGRRSWSGRWAKDRTACQTNSPYLLVASEQRRFPIIAALMPDSYHEVFLYVLNFLMVLQGFKVWQNWKHSPASSMIRKWQASRVARMLKKVRSDEERSDSCSYN